MEKVIPKTTKSQQDKIEELKLYLMSTKESDVFTLAKIVTSEYMCDLANIDNPRYKGLYKKVLRLKEKYTKIL